jgi:hypothetical protein
VRGASAEKKLPLAGATFVLAVAIALTVAAHGYGEPATAGVTPLPLLGPADPEAILMGSSPGGDPGEAWAYRELPLSVGSVSVESRKLAFGPQPDPHGPEQQLVFLRHTDSSGWQVFDTPVDQSGNPYRGPNPNRLSARITREGGGVLVGRDANRPPEEQVVVLYHQPGGSWRALPAPPPDVLFPAEGERPAEALAADRGSGAVADAAFNEAGHTGLFFAPFGRSVADGIIHYDGETWSREPVQVPAGSESDFHIRAVDATGLGNAWAIAEADPSLGRSFVLLERTSTASGPLWVERGIGAARFADRDTPADGIAGLAPIGGAAQPLTVTEDGVWIDLTGSFEGSQLDATIYYDIGAAAVTGSWCDASACEAPFGVKLSRQLGYRSFAWPGPGFGTRVITNPLDPGGGEDSNRGTYLRFSEGRFSRMPGGGANFRPSGAFSSVEDGWLQGPIEISGKTAPDLLRHWPIPLRAPLTAVTGAPGAPPGAIGSGALAVGEDGAVARYTPGQGWQREYLTTSSGAVNRSTLRGVAWPEPTHAYAVGDHGAMWEWNADDGLWIADPGVPIGFEGNLTGIAFDPSNPSRGYAVGKNGVLLGFGKSWEQEQLPPGLGEANLTSIAFAGSEAIVAAGGDLLVNDGGGWHVDASAHALLEGVRDGNPQLLTVAGLPDGGAIAAGRDIVIERDSPGSPWRFSDQPLPDSTVIAAAAIRPAPGQPVRAVVSVVPEVVYPPADELPLPDENVPPPILPPSPPPGDGYLLRETASGWEDEQRTAYAGTGPDRPIKSDPTLALLLDASGEGWAVGGWSGEADAAGRGTSAHGSIGAAVRERVRTAAISRFGAGAASAPVDMRAEPVPMPADAVRFAVAGNAECEQPCAQLAPESLGPDRTLSAALSLAARMQGGWGPRALLYTGNRVRTGLNPADAERYASLLGAQPGLPVYPALGSDDVREASGSSAFESTFAAFSGPFGAGAAPGGVSTSGIPGAAPEPGARTHYAFDTSGPGGTVRVVVIDNSRGSLAASDPYQNPPEPQLPWLESVLADARAKGIPVVVMGNRSLNTSFTPKLNVASDGSEVARALVEGGASVYLFDQPEENRATRIPAGGGSTIPSFGTGTLGYRSQLSGVVGSEAADSLFGDTGVMVLELDTAHPEPGTNRVPVSARLIPVIQDLSLEAIDGTLLRRSIPALFSGLGRRPRGGDRWGAPAAGSGTPDPAGGDPYTLFPPEQCLVGGCSSRVPPEYTFTSSDPDIADFVRQDPNSTNLRKPYLDSNGKVLTDNSSGLLCPFNAGTTKVTISAGGFAYSEQVTVQGGSVQRPCGTRPLRPDRFKRATPGAVPPAPPQPPPASPAPVSFQPPPPPVSPAPPAPPQPPPANPVAPHPAPAPFLPLSTGLVATVPAALLPPPPPVVRPLPPGGAPARTYQVEERREEEVATEESQAFSRRDSGEGPVVPLYLPALILLAAIGAASIRGGPGARHRHRPAAALGRAQGGTGRRA